MRRQTSCSAIIPPKLPSASDVTLSPRRTVFDISGHHLHHAEEKLGRQQQMSKNKPDLINALRETAKRLDDGAKYEWGHMGRCNCGHLVQTITDMTDYEIVKSIDFQLDEWSEHAQDYCAGTGHKVDDLFSALNEVGFDYQDVIQLENLSDKRVLARLSTAHPYLRKNCAADVTLYMCTMADMIEEESLV